MRQLTPSKVLIKESDLDKINQDIQTHAKDHNETGWSGFGVIHENLVYEITEISIGGKNEERSPTSFSPDTNHVRDNLRDAIRNNPETRWLVDGHSHPWDSTPEPSSIDVNQLIEIRKDRAWTIIAVHSSTNECKFFGLNHNCNGVIEIPHQIIPDSFQQENLLSRIQMITDNETLQKKKVAILGCGSLVGGVVTSLVGTGIRKYVIGDMDKFSDVNVIRHLGDIYDITKPKTEIIKQYIESHNPLATVKTIQDDFIKNRKLLHAVIRHADIIIASSGNPDLNYQINAICTELKKPCVYGGIYEKAESGYAFWCDGTKESACFDCIFKLTSGTISQGAVNRKYGLEDGELSSAQGMFADILPVGCIMAKMALWILLKQRPECNLVRYHNTLKTERFNVAKRELCATCDYEKWLQCEEENIVCESSSNVVSISDSKNNTKKNHHHAKSCTQKIILHIKDIIPKKITGRNRK